MKNLYLLPLPPRHELRAARDRYVHRDTRRLPPNRIVVAGLTATLIGVLALTATPAAALHYLEPEESISDLLVEMSVQHREEKEKKEKEGGREWAIVPQVGYGPETSFVIGAKFTDRNILSSGATFDLDAVYAIEGQQGLTVGLASPTSITDRFPLIIRASYKLDPKRRFFGLGNNKQGPDQVSRHELQRLGGDVTLGWRVLNNLSLNAQGGAWQQDVRRGDGIDEEPPTIEAFPNLPGIDGGIMVPIAVSLVYDERWTVTRPTKGWRFLLKASYDIGEFHFARIIGDLSYLYPLFDERLVLGARLGGHWIPDDLADGVPFWALADLGGEYQHRGYFPYRFLGTSSVIGSAEARVKLFDFNFFSLWQVVVDGVGFGEVGRVFIKDSDLVALEGGTSACPLPGGIDCSLSQTDHLPISYGGGLRFGLDDAILARIDVGFSDEETALIYLTFGHTF
jgi:outer membrane protein assembly factor BamA